jgi:hypothetical protein
MLPAATDGDRFEVRARIGSGGNGVVYRVLDRGRGAEVALKTLTASGGRELYRFKREFRALVDLAHPNLVALHELHTYGDEWLFTMELVDGVPFHEYVRPPPTGVAVESQEETAPRHVGPRQLEGLGPLDPVRLREALYQIADGLHALHGAGKLHRDIKPSNVLVDRSGRVVILDFGLVTDVESDHVDRTHDRVAVGTPAYMSPEQASGDEELDGRSDQYSLACVLYEMLAGAPPFSGTTPRATIARRFTEAPPSVRLERDVPEALDRAIRRALAPVPADRYADVRAFAKALEATETRPQRFSGNVAALGIPAVAAMALALIIWWPKGGGADTIDPGLHAVLPFDIEGTRATGDLDGAAVARHLGRAMEFWRDIRVVDARRALDAIDRHGPLRTLSEALAVARGLGGGACSGATSGRGGTASRCGPPSTTCAPSARSGRRPSRWAPTSRPSAPRSRR